MTSLTSLVHRSFMDMSEFCVSRGHPKLAPAIQVDHPCRIHGATCEACRELSRWAPAKHGGARLQFDAPHGFPFSSKPHANEFSRSRIMFGSE